MPLFKLFEKYPELIYGFSEKSDGSMRLGDNKKIFALNLERRKKYFAKKNIFLSQITQASLVHRDKIKKITKKDASKIIPSTDGLISSEKNLFLTLTGADCFPIYFFDPDKKAIGVAHAGWKGVVKNITGKVINKMLKAFESNPRNILIGIGPGIRACHFEIKKENIHFFKKYHEHVLKRKGKIFVDLPGIIKKQLLMAGVNNNNIEDSKKCTFCLKNKYFSYRRDKPKIIKAMIAHIGIKETEFDKK